MVMAWFADGYIHPDEHFQILEFAGYKLNLTEKANLPWEFHSQMRPSLQPEIAILIYRFFSLFGTPDPFFIAFILRVLTAILSFFGMCLMYKAYENEFSNETLKRWFLLLSFFLWFILFINVRFTSETCSGSVFLIAFAYLKAKRSSSLQKVYLVTGVLLGLSFLFRYQTALLILGMVLWLLTFGKESLPRMVILGTGIIIVFVLGLLLDRWFYGEWTVTAWNYLQQNIIYDKVSGFGIQPWWFYFKSTFYEGIPPFSLVYIAAVLIFLFFRRGDLIAWTLFPFLTVHFIIGHKEMRFLFPIIGFLPVIISKTIELICIKWNPQFLQLNTVKYLSKIFWVANLIMLTIVTFVPVDTEVRLFQTIYRDYPGPTTLYFLNENPYRRALDINFYKRENLTITKVDSGDQIHFVQGQINLVVTRTNPDIEGLNLSRRLIYCNFPDYVSKLNFNHWIERTHFWYVYELTPITVP